METIDEQAFITIPVLKSQQTSLNQKSKNSLLLRQKIVHLIKSFTNKQILNQAINNIGIPKNFIDVYYVQSRPDQQMSKIYIAVCTLKKQTARIMRYSNNIISSSNIISFQSKKKLQQSPKNNFIQKKQKKQFILKKQLSLDQKIKIAIQKQLEYRQKVQKRQKKQILSEKLKNNILEKKKEVAKNLNKKVTQVYLKQKQKKQSFFQQISKTHQLENLKQTQQKSLKKQSKISVFRHYTTLNSRNQARTKQSFTQNIQNQKINFQLQFNQYSTKQLNKDKSINQFKHRRLNSMNQKIVFKQIKSQQIRQRKINTYQQDQNQKLKKWILKQHKIKQSRSPYSNMDESRNSQMMQQTSSNIMTSSNLFRNSNFSSINVDNIFTYEDQKQNQIQEKITQKSYKRQQLINIKVEKLKQKRLQEQIRREIYKQQKMKLLMHWDQFQQNKESINHNNIKRSNLFMKDVGQQVKQLLHPQPNPQQINIKNKHQKMLANLSCEQTILRLRKLPKSVLQKKFKYYKNMELRNISARSLAQILC